MKYSTEEAFICVYTVCCYLIVLRMEWSRNCNSFCLELHVAGVQDTSVYSDNVYVDCLHENVNMFYLFRQSEIICDHDCSNYKVVNVVELSALRIISIQMLASRSGKPNPYLDMVL